MRKHFFLPFLIIFISNADAQLTPEITSWIINTTGETGYDGIPSNIQQVQYSDSNVYVSATCIPGYDIGPWAGNPNTPANQNFVYRITRFPQQNTGTLISPPLGHIGVWSNGVSIFNAQDAHSYNNLAIWNQNAIVVEGAGFDSCLGHPAPNGEYHHHLNPRCLYDDADSLNHSPIIGYAFDGYPVYGAYGCANTDGTGGIKRMKSSYEYRNITQRHSLPDGTVLNAPQYGPDISGTYPLGYYIEDFEYIINSGDLDEHNGRWCITPDYPQGTYAYFITIDAALNATYPYTLGLTYYGIVPAGNTGPGSGHNTINESVTTYDPTGIADLKQQIGFEVFPNPVSDVLAFFVNPFSPNNLSAKLYNSLGELISQQENVQPSVVYSVDVSMLSSGIYFLKIQDEKLQKVRMVVVNH
ncbi:MAG TPA: YHYH protein [Chitinophagales bacterium]|nr:YHYH protein [Chitinophagales bacterium]